MVNNNLSFRLDFLNFRVVIFLFFNIMGYLLEVIFYEMLKICKGKTSNNKKIFWDNCVLDPKIKI